MNDYKLKYYDYSDCHYYEIETDDIEINGKDISEYENQIRADERAKMLMPYDVESIDDLIENVRTKALDEIEKNIDSWWNEIQGDESDDDKNWYSSLKMLLEELRK